MNILKKIFKILFVYIIINFVNIIQVYAQFVNVYRQGGGIETYDIKQIDSINFTDTIPVAPVKKVSIFGDSTLGAMKTWLAHYFSNIGFTFYEEGRGGEQTNCMGAYQGSMPILISEVMQIPSSGYVEFYPKSSLMRADGEYSNYQTFGKFDPTGRRYGLNPVTIGGIKGNLSSSVNLVPYGLCFYDSHGWKAIIYKADSYGQTITEFNTLQDRDITSLRVCINAYNQTDIDNAACHVTINGHIIDLKEHFTEPNKYIRIGGDLADAEGFYTSEFINISEYSPIETLYLDGLATGTKLSFTRLEDGESKTIGKFTPVQSESYDVFKNCITLLYVNNFLPTGRDIAEDWVYQFKKFSEYNNNGKYIVANTHYMFGMYPEEVIDKIESALANEFAEHYFSGYQYLKNEGIQDAIDMGIIQESDTIGKTWKDIFLGSDEKPDPHENEIAGYLLARQFIKIGINLNYWPEADYSYEYLK